MECGNRYCEFLFYDLYGSVVNRTGKEEQIVDEVSINLKPTPENHIQENKTAD